MSLTGKRVVNTRAAHQAAELNALLRAAGAIPLDYPCIAIVPPEDTGRLDQALLGDFDLLVLTSANTVMLLAQRVKALGLSFAGRNAAAVGAQTAQAARDVLGVAVSVVPDEYAAEALADALPITANVRVLLPQSELARPALAESLAARGAQVTAVTAYRTVRGSGGVSLAPLLQANRVDAVTFTSPSTVRFFVERLASEGAAPGRVPVACIGGQTTRAAQDCGFPVILEARTHTLEGLTEALATYFQMSA